MLPEQLHPAGAEHFLNAYFTGPVGADGRFVEHVPLVAGLKIDVANETLIQLMTERGRLLRHHAGTYLGHCAGGEGPAAKVSHGKE